ncbi:MAG: S24 family peptidase [Rickettsiales bacterium]|nr:S24 family peptidase [Rickettsiales bacterium]
MKPITSEFSNIIGMRLRAEMKRQDVGVADLAQKADVKTSFIYDVISGKSSNPSTVKLARVADVLGISLAYLVGTTDNPLQGVKPVSHDKDNDYVTISRLLVDISAGGGTIVSREEEGEQYYFRKQWIREHLGVTPSDLRMLHVRGDSMEPTLCHNDIILVDTTKKIPSPPGLFVVFDGFGLMAKRLEYIAGTSPQKTRIISDNMQYTTYERLADETFVVGRVVWFAREI